MTNAAWRTEMVFKSNHLLRGERQVDRFIKLDID